MSSIFLVWVFDHFGFRLSSVTLYIVCVCAQATSCETSILNAYEKENMLTHFSQMAGFQQAFILSKVTTKALNPMYLSEKVPLLVQHFYS